MASRINRENLTDQRICFLVLAHTDPQQLLRLCKQLAADGDPVIVHWDGRSPNHEIMNLEFPASVRFTDRRVPSYWADFSLVEATLVLLEEAMQLVPKPMRLVLLSGACYPIKPLRLLRAYFIGRPDRNEIRYTDMTKDWRSFAWFLERFHYRRPWLRRLLNRPHGAGQWTWGSAFPNLLDKVLRKAATLALRPWARQYRKKFPMITPYFGSQFWSITPSCGKMILDFVAGHPRFVDFYRHSFSPDEHFFSTIIANSDFAETTDGEVPHTGPARENYNLANLHVPRFDSVTADDLDELVASHKFFARKFSSTASGSALDWIDQQSAVL